MMTALNCKLQSCQIEPKTEFIAQRFVKEIHSMLLMDVLSLVDHQRVKQRLQVIRF